MLWVKYLQQMLSLRNKNKIKCGYPSNLGYLYLGPDNKKNIGKNVIFFLYIGFNICFGCSKEPSH